MASLTRRAFLRLAALASASGTALWGLPGCAAVPPPRRDPAHPRRVFADLHAHPSLNRWIENTYAGQVQPLAASLARSAFNKTTVEWKACREAGIDMICAAHFNLFDEWLAMPTDPNPDAPRQTHRMLDRLEADLRGEAAPYAALARNHQDLRRILGAPGSSHPIAVVHTLEGGHALGQDLNALEGFAARGVASITITHFFFKGIAPAANAFPFFPDSEAPYLSRGLTEFGRRVVREMERLGMIVDISHAPTRTVEDVLAVAGKPIIASHSSARALGDHAYSIHDRHIRDIVERGGLFGIILMPYWLSNYSDVHQAETRGGLADVVRTARHVAELTGTHKGLAIGSDFGGFIPRLKEIHRLSRIQRLGDALREEFTADETADIMANNAVEFFLANWRSGLPS